MRNNKTLSYTLIQCLYWTTYCLMFCFTSAFLLDKGFSNGSIGVVLGLSYALSALMQPLIAGYVRSSGVRLSSCMACIYALITLLAAAIRFLPLQGVALAAVMICMLLLQSALQPSVNSLPRSYQLRGVKINFGFARGMGSFAFSLVSLAAGQLLGRFAMSLLPALYCATALLMTLCLIFFRSPAFTVEETAAEAPRSSLLRRYPRFAIFLVGLVCLSLAHICLDNFMLQIIRTKGGDSAEMGIAISVAAFTELPAMVLYARMARRSSPQRLLCLAGWVWSLKTLLVMLAPNPQTVYLAQLLQFLSYAIYVPATVDYISRKLPQADFLKGQALAGSAFTLGSLLAAFLGGRLIDLMGVASTMLVMQAFTVIGATLFTLALLRREAK